MNMLLRAAAMLRQLFYMVRSWSQKQVFCCHCRRPNETDQGQRQQTHLKKQDFAATVLDPMKPTGIKGSNSASGSRILLPPPWTRWNPPRAKAANAPREVGFCCHCRRPNETHQGQRQQLCLGSRCFVASTTNPMKCDSIESKNDYSYCSLKWRFWLWQ